MIYQSESLSKKKKKKQQKSLDRCSKHSRTNSLIRRLEKWFEPRGNVFTLQLYPENVYPDRPESKNSRRVAFSPMIPRDRDSKGSRKRRSRFILTPFIPFEFSPEFLSPRSEKRIDPIFERRREEASRGMRRGWKRMWKPPQRACSHLLKTGIYIYISSDWTGIRNEEAAGHFRPPIPWLR